MEKVSLYIHIPFCKQKCLYCDFPSFSSKEGLMTEYVVSLAKEIDNMPKIRINTIYIGGGTPTYLSFENWEIIRNSVDKLDKDKGTEFTVEGNPGTFKKDTLELLKAMGVNRLSIGLQAAQNSLLKTLGRIHSFEEFKESYTLARKCGFENINVDIMFGLPNQKLEDAMETVREVIKLSPEHISCYGLIIEEGTPFYKMQQEDRLPLPSEELEREMYDVSKYMLEKFGYHQYEISNFSKEGFECKHNIVYWDLQEYIGCGSGAHSYIDGKRLRNSNSIEEYICRMKNSNSGTIEQHENTLEDNMEEFMFMGLRKLAGISEEDFMKRFNRNINSIYGKVINKYVDEGLLKREEKRIFLSSRGIEISNSIMCDFILDKK